jgi:hypothetical protein
MVEMLLTADPGVADRASTIGTILLWVIGIVVAGLVMWLALMGIGWIIEKAPWLVALWILAIPVCAAVGYIYNLDACYGAAIFMTIISIGAGVAMS